MGLRPIRADEQSRLRPLTPGELPVDESIWGAPVHGPRPMQMKLGQSPRTGDIMELPQDFSKRQANFFGVSTEGAPLDVMARGDLTLERPEDYERLLQMQYPDQNVNVRQHPELEEITFKVGEGPETLLFTPGSATQDIAANVSAIPSLAAEVGAGIVAAPTGPAGITVASALTAGATRAARLASGKALGYHDLSGGEILIESAKDAGLALLGGAVGEGVGALLRRFSASPQIKSMLANMTDAEKDATETALRKYLNDSGVTGDEVDLTVSQILRMSDEVAPSTARTASTIEASVSKPGDALSLARGEFEQGLEAQARQAETIALPDTAETALLAPQLTDEIATTAARSQSGRQATIQQFRDESLGAYEAQLDELFASPDLGVGVEALTSGLQQARRNTIEGINSKYGEFYSGLGDIGINLNGARSVALGHKRRLDSDILPALSAEDRSIVDNVLNAGIKKETRPGSPAGQIIDPSTGQPFIKAVPQTTHVVAEDVSIDTVSRAITALKSELRRQKIDQRGETKFLSETVSALQKARDEAIERAMPGGAATLKELDGILSSTLSGMEESTVTKIVSDIGKAATSGRPNTIIANLIGGGGSGARSYMELIEGGNTQLLESLPLVKDAIRGHYKKAVLDAPNKAAAHAAYMRKYSDGLEAVMSPKEFSSFTSGSRSAIHAMNQEQALAKEIEGNISRSFEGRLASTSNDNIVDMIVGSPSAIGDTRKLVKLLSESPEQLTAYKGIRGRRLVNDITTPDDVSGARVFDPNKLDEILRSDVQLGELTELYGKEYTDSLQQMSEWMRLADSTSQEKLAPEMLRLVQEAGPASASLMAWRAMVARPLTRAGLMTTSGLKVMRTQGSKALSNLMANPEQFLKAMTLYRGNAPIDKWRPILSSVGLGNILDE